jgi:hypothetical protein
MYVQEGTACHPCSLQMAFLRSAEPVIVFRFLSLSSRVLSATGAQVGFWVCRRPPVLFPGLLVHRFVCWIARRTGTCGF